MFLFISSISHSSCLKNNCWRQWPPWRTELGNRKKRIFKKLKINKNPDFSDSQIKPATMLQQPDLNFETLCSNEDGWHLHQPVLSQCSKLSLTLSRQFSLQSALPGCSTHLLIHDSSTDTNISPEKPNEWIWIVCTVATRSKAEMTKNAFSMA